MSASDNTEKILRGLHVMLSRSEMLPGDQSKVIVDREGMIALLKELNKCIYAMMDEYEMTRRSRDAAEREFRKHGDEIIKDASMKAEDIYAASVMYTDEALNSIQEIMTQAKESVKAIYDEMEDRLKEEAHNVRTNQLELKSQLQDLMDTEKYIKLIEERNQEIQKEKEEKEDRKAKWSEKNRYADRQTEVRINTEVLERMGISLEEDETEEDPTGEALRKQKKATEESVKSDNNSAKKVENKGKAAGKKKASKKQEESVLDLNEEADIITSTANAGAVKQTNGVDILDLAADGEVQDIKKKFGVKKQAQQADVRVNYDSDYFKWRAEQEKLTKKETAQAIRDQKREEFAQESAAQRELSKGIHELMKGFQVDE